MHFQGQVVDSAITESVFNMLEGCVTEFAMAGVQREPSGSTISGTCMSISTSAVLQAPDQDAIWSLSAEIHRM